MLKLFDSGCGRHHPRHIALTGGTAVWVNRLLLNLTPTETGHMYICEHGYTHCLSLQTRRAKSASTPPGLKFRGDKAAVH
jgi:hypothetical protein